MQCWADSLFLRGRLHGSRMVELMQERDPDGLMIWPSLADAALARLIAAGEAVPERPEPTPEQRWHGAGGTFAVSGAGAPWVCWWFRRP